MSIKKINFPAALSVVIANMIGTGVFTSLGFQLLGITDFAAILCLWIVGGIIALLGSFAYSELGAALPKSGGEYNFLSKIYHPFIGFLSGWVSATIGFAAPIALAASALGSYSSAFLPGVSPKLIGAGVIIFITLIQSFNNQLGGGFQTIATSLKVLLIIVFCFMGLTAPAVQNISFSIGENTYPAIFSGAFAISLVYVSYAYSGWNASAYIAGDTENPKRNIPLSILLGTLIVAVLYVFLNYIFLRTAPIAEMTGVPEVATVPAKYIFGESGGRIISLIISLLLVSTISSMVIVGPRVIAAIGEDFSIFKLLATKNKNNVPVRAIVFQSAIALTLLFTSQFQTILNYTTFVLTLFATLTVFGVILLRIKSPALERPYKTWGYPVTPILFVLVNCWFMYFIVKDKTMEAFIGLGILAVGAVVYLVANNYQKKINATKA